MQPWSRLLEAREAQELTQRDIADALNLPINIVDALETGDLSKLPDRVFTRGYVRAYAKYLDLDADALVTAYDAEVEAEPAVDASSHAESKTGALPAWLLQPPALIGAGVIVLLLVVIGFMSTGSEDAPEATEPVAISDERVVDPAHQLVAQPQGTASSTDTSAPAESLADKSDADAVTEVFSRGELQDDQQENAQAAQLEDPQTEPQTFTTNSLAYGVTPRRLSDTGNERLDLVFSEDCWVEISRPDGDNLYANLGKIGDEWAFVGKGPFRIVLGYAPGVDLRYNGESVALHPHTRNNVATIVIGQ